MKELLLFRHGIAEDVEPGQRDAERRLTAEGRTRTTQVARGIAGFLTPGGLIAHSPLVRAEETATLLAQHLRGYRREETAVLVPGTDAATVLEWADARAEDGPVVLVGHEPQMNEILGLSVTAESRALADFKKAGSCLLTFDGALAPGRGSLAWLLPPSLAVRLEPQPGT